MLGLPEGVTACLFDLDGVLTETAVVHAQAWKTMFDQFLEDWAAEHGSQFVAFDPVEDYDRYVDGRPRYEGVASFLASSRASASRWPTRAPKASWKFSRAVIVGVGRCAPEAR